MQNLEARIAVLEAKLLALQDTIEIYQLISAYGPAVDRADSGAVNALWREGGTYDWGGGVAQGHSELAAMIGSERHRQMLAMGAAHVLSLPHVTLNGDKATALGHSCLYLREGADFVLIRVSASRWELERTGDGWRVQSRINRTLDGDEAARALLEPPPRAF